MAHAARAVRAVSLVPASSRVQTRAVVASAVRTVPAPNTSVRRPRSRSRDEAACRAVFQIMMVVLVCLVGFGMLRVTLSGKAAEASIDAGRLRQEIRAAQLVADDLEVDRSALMTPSRIEAIATSTMRMASPGSVKYIAMPGRTPADDRRTNGDTSAPTTAAKSAGLGEEAGTGMTSAVGSGTAQAQTAGFGAAFNRALTTVVTVAAGGAHLLLGVDSHVVSGGQ